VKTTTTSTSQHVRVRSRSRNDRGDLGHGPRTHGSFPGEQDNRVLLFLHCDPVFVRRRLPGTGDRRRTSEGTISSRGEAESGSRQGASTPVEVPVVFSPQGSATQPAGVVRERCNPPPRNPQNDHAAYEIRAASLRTSSTGRPARGRFRRDSAVRATAGEQNLGTRRATRGWAREQSTVETRWGTKRRTSTPPIALSLFVGSADSPRSKPRILAGLAQVEDPPPRRASRVADQNAGRQWALRTLTEGRPATHRATTFAATPFTQGSATPAEHSFPKTNVGDWGSFSAEVTAQRPSTS